MASAARDPRGPQPSPRSAAPLAGASHGRGVPGRGAVSRQSAATSCWVNCPLEGPVTNDSKLHAETDFCPEPKRTEIMCLLTGAKRSQVEKGAFLVAKSMGLLP